MRHSIIIAVACALIPAGIKAQNSFEEFQKRNDNRFKEFEEKVNNDYNEFRDKVNREYENLMKQTWNAYEALATKPLPQEDNPLPPVVFPQDDQDIPLVDNPCPIEDVITVAPIKPQPQPVVPIDVKPTPAPSAEKYMTIDLLGLDAQVRIDGISRISIGECNSDNIAGAWKQLADGSCDRLTSDCLALRESHKLCDWAYLMLLRDVAQAFFGKACDEATLLAAHLYSSSGYAMRLALDEDAHLTLLYGSDHTILNKRYWHIDGINFYALDNDAVHLHICQASYPGEKPMSLIITREQSMAMLQTRNRTLKSEKYSDLTADVSTNKHLIDFYDSYPTSRFDDKFGSRWAMYANTPLSQKAKSSLYPSLKTSINGLSQLAAVNRLLNFVQTAFVYEYDDKVWGYDRAFFPDETLYYPYCDCEDRSILFSRLVRDLLGLEVVLIYYPGHLATAVHFNEDVSGDYISLHGIKYVVCDPTYINAGVGRTMPRMDNSKAKVILLE